MSELEDLIGKMDSPDLLEADIIPWGSPIMSFGDFEKSKIATLGINPSNREFVGTNGNELDGFERRFHTLKSLHLNQWKDLQPKHISIINESFKEYFLRNPYDGWFKKLDYLISETSISYYFPSSEACHLDLIPYATRNKWSDLNSKQQNALLTSTVDILGELIKRSAIEIMVLNGQTVVENLQKVSNKIFLRKLNEDWTLKRKSGEGVSGYSYTGFIDKIGDTHLNKKVKVLGFNHNIQSSFGISSAILSSLKDWITFEINRHFNESE